MSKALFEAELALGEGLVFGGELDPCEQEILSFRKSQLSNDAEGVQNHLMRALEISRSSEQRNHLLEARIRMEWGLVRASLGELEQAGTDLKWAMERLGALEDGHHWHGLSILNMGAWHVERGEWAMALAILSSISRHGPHAVEIIALSRRQAAEVLIGIEDHANALRHLWVAHHGFLQTELFEMAIDSGLHWLDIALSEVSAEAPRMEAVIETASPRSYGEAKPRCWVHPTDVEYMSTWLESHVSDDHERLVLQDAAQALQS